MSLDMLRQYTEYVEEHLEDPYLTNAAIARQIGTSERTLYRLVQHRLGLSPNHYLRERRLDRAEELIRSGEYRTVKEIALRVGFIKVSYFSQKYEASRGVNPRQLLVA